MRPLIQLPRTARLTWNLRSDLVIDNHEIVTEEAFMDWVSWGIRYGIWDKILMQFKQQGFHIEAVIQQCILDILDSRKDNWMLAWDKSGITYNSITRQNFNATTTEKNIRAEFVIKLHTCKNWDDLGNLLNHQSDFSKKMAGKITRGYKACIQ